jgi:hypothetical protein
MKVRAGHTPLQFSDNNKQHSSDVRAIFGLAQRRRWGWFTGTEAGPGAGNTSDLLMTLADDFGFRMFCPSAGKGEGSTTDCWVAAREDLIDGGWKTDFIPVIPGSSELYKREGLDPDLNPRWGPKGLVTVGFNTEKLGRVNVAAMHALTKGASDVDAKSVFHGVDHYMWNDKLQKAAGDWGRKVGKGSALAFLGSDQNDSDVLHDTFRGQPFTSAADELKTYESTGHGAIDVIASYNGDGRVKASKWVVLDDKEFFLEADHYVCEATFTVEPLPNKR